MLIKQSNFDPKRRRTNAKYSFLTTLYDRDAKAMKDYNLEPDTSQKLITDYGNSREELKEMIEEKMELGEK